MPPFQGFPVYVPEGGWIFTLTLGAVYAKMPRVSPSFARNFPVVLLLFLPIGLDTS